MSMIDTRHLLYNFYEMPIHKTIKKHASHVVRHLKAYKHHYTIGALGVFAVIKTVVLLIGLFGFLSIKNTFADYNDGLVGTGLWTQTQMTILPIQIMAHFLM